MCNDETMLAENRKDPLLLRQATPRWFFGAEAAQVQAIDRASEFHLPVLFLQGSADTVAAPSVTRQVYEAVSSTDKMLQEYPNLLHELLRETCRASIYRQIVDWIDARISPQYPVP